MAKDWLIEALKVTKKMMDNLPERTKVALENERLFMEALKLRDVDC